MLTYDDNMFPKIVLLSQKNTCLCFLRRPVSVESEVNENSAIKLDYMHVNFQKVNSESTRKNKSNKILKCCISIVILHPVLVH